MLTNEGPYWQHTIWKMEVIEDITPINSLDIIEEDQKL